MISELSGALLIALIASLVGYLLVQGAKNRQKHQFFKKFAPGLKVAENPSLFGGHANQIVHVRYNWSKFEELFKKYGPTVGIYYGTKPAVVTCDLDFIKKFAIEESIHINRMRPDVPLKEGEEDCIITAEDEQWVRIRKAIGPALSKHRISSPIVKADIDRIIDRFVGLIDRRLDQAKEIRQEEFIEENADDICHRYALALVFASFYKQDEVIDFNSEKDYYVELLDRNLPKLFGFFAKICAAFPSLKPLVDWLMLNFDELGVLRKTLMKYIKQQTLAHFEAAKQVKEAGLTRDQRRTFDGIEHFTLKDGSKFRRNLIDYVIDHYREGKLTKSEYFNSTFFLILAADKTTSDAISRLLYILANHPEVQEKLRASILESGVESEYLHWVIHESLRLQPPALLGCTRTLKHDIQTKHGLVPAGTLCFTPTYSINRLKEYWGQDADEFKPERWANAKSFHPVQFISFGTGRRGCPGRDLALLEMKKLIKALMLRYKFEKSKVHTQDNSKLFTSPITIFSVFDTPTFVRISRL